MHRGFPGGAGPTQTTLPGCGRAGVTDDAPVASGYVLRLPLHAWRISGRTPASPVMAIADDWPATRTRDGPFLRELQRRGRTTPVTADTWAPAVGALVGTFTALPGSAIGEVGGDAAAPGPELITGWIDEHERGAGMHGGRT